MKRAIAWMMSLALLLAAVACAEGEAPTFEALEDLEWSFSSGAGAWSTDLRIAADGSFSGQFHDSEMGDAGDEYPYGTVYYANFTGRMTLGEQLDEHSWSVHIDALAQDEEPGSEEIADELRYVAAEPYGITKGDDMVLYAPGTPVDALTEEMRMWAHLFDMEEAPAELSDWFLYSENNDSGFLSYQGLAEDELGLANPWQDMTREELLEASGLTFGVPDGAENVIYRWLADENLAEMQFTLDGDEYCARIQPAALEEGELLNISGMYLPWDNEEEVTIGHCPGTLGLSQTGSEDWTELCLWYDVVPGLMYSLSVYTVDPDGLDLTAVAAMVQMAE